MARAARHFFRIPCATTSTRLPLRTANAHLEFGSPNRVRCVPPVHPARHNSLNSCFLPTFTTFTTVTRCCFLRTPCRLQASEILLGSTYPGRSRPAHLCLLGPLRKCQRSWQSP